MGGTRLGRKSPRRLGSDAIRYPSATVVPAKLAKMTDYDTVLLRKIRETYDDPAKMREVVYEAARLAPGGRYKSKRRAWAISSRDATSANWKTR
jgi:hypothetical protein